MNRAQKLIILTGGLVLLLLLLFPPWQQAALHETDYRQNIGRGFVFKRPQPVAVECYFPGCKTAPASYFHVTPYSAALIDQSATVFCLTVAAVLLFRNRRDGSRPTLKLRTTRLIFSVIIALTIPQGNFPLAVLLLDIPRQIIHRNELWLMPVLLVPLVFAAYTTVVYLLLTALLWLLQRRSQRTFTVQA
jgi:hypothetical protein